MNIKSLIAFLLLSSSVLALNYSYTNIESMTTVCDKAPLLNVTNFIATPNPAYNDQLIIFSVTTKNNGNCYNMDNISLNIIGVYNSFGINVWNSSKVVSGGILAHDSITTEFYSTYFSTDMYTVNLSLSYNVLNFSNNSIFSSANTSSFNLTITARPPSVIPGGGGTIGGGGIALPSGITQPAFVQFQKYPVLQEVGPGTSVIVDLSLKNPATSSQKIGISLTGIPSNWINLFESNITLGPYQTRTISFTVVVPENAEAGDYLVKADIHDTTIKGYSYFIIRVKEYPSNYSAPQIYRRVNLNFVDNTSSVDITVVNDAAMHRKVNVYEKIPKAIADNVDQVDFQTAPTEIVQADPIVMFSLENIAPRERREIKYDVNNVISEYEPYVYWPIDRIDVLYEKGLEKVQVSNVYQTILNPGEDNYLLLDVGNIYSAPVDVVIQTWLPKGWNSTPASIELNIPPLSQTNIRFKINVPFDANMGVYYGTLQLQYENSIISKELVFRVQEISLFGGIIGFFMSLINSGFLLALVIAFLIIMGVRIARREMNRGYEYKGDVGRTLGEIKGILKRR